MELDDLKQNWAGAAQRSLRIDERRLRELLLRKLRFALAPYVLWRAFEAAVGVGALFLVVPVLLAHFGEPLYLASAGPLALFTALISASSLYLLVHALQLRFDGPVTGIQRDLERQKLAEYRAFKWALLGGVLLWLPAVLVLFEALTGVPAIARVDPGWLAANLAFGLVALVLGQLWSRKHVERADLSPFARRVVDSLAGWSLRRASGHLAELSSFETEEQPGNRAQGVG